MHKLNTSKFKAIHRTIRIADDKRVIEFNQMEGKEIYLGRE